VCIKAIFFDMDGTLVYVPISSTQFLMNIYQELGLNFSLEQIAVAREKAEKWWNEKFSDYTFRMWEAFVEYNCKLLAALGAKGDLQRLAEKVQSHWENFPEEADEKLYPEVGSVLETLREERITLAVLSNRLIDFSLRSLEKHGIRGYFQSVIGPRIAGAPKGKLSLEMWRYALNRVGATPNEVFHIDNDYETGIMGAREAGIRPILLDRKDTYTSIIDCTIIHDLTEILELLGI